MLTIRSKRLEPYVDKIIWQGQGSVKPFTVYPDIYHVMGIQALGDVQLIRDGRAEPLQHAGITGIHREARVFQSTLSLSSVLIYFRPQVLFKWQLCSPQELIGRSLSLAELRMPVNWDQIVTASQQDPQVFIAVVEEMVWSMCKDIEIDRWAQWAVGRVTAARGLERIEKIAEEAVLSTRQFERRFTERIGMTPKTFAQIVKFQQVFTSMGKAASLTDLAHETGYYDQSHFIKDIRKMSGLLPSQLRQLTAGSGSAAKVINKQAEGINSWRVED